MNQPSISDHPLTCVGEAYLAETLESWRGRDWGQVAELEVLVNEDGNIPQRVFSGFVQIMRSALTGFRTAAGWQESAAAAIGRQPPVPVRCARSGDFLQHPERRGYRSRIRNACRRVAPGGGLRSRAA